MPDKAILAAMIVVGLIFIGIFIGGAIVCGAFQRTEKNCESKGTRK